MNEFSRQDLAPLQGAFFILKNGRRPRTNGYSKAYHLLELYHILYTFHILKVFKRIFNAKKARAFDIPYQKMVDNRAPMGARPPTT